MTTYEARCMTGDLLVNRIPDQEADPPVKSLGYKLALGKVMKTGVKGVEEGDLRRLRARGRAAVQLPAGHEVRL
jgi:hypothetical protein